MTLKGQNCLCSRDINEAINWNKYRFGIIQNRDSGIGRVAGMGNECCRKMHGAPGRLTIDDETKEVRRLNLEFNPTGCFSKTKVRLMAQSLTHLKLNPEGLYSAT